MSATGDATPHIRVVKDAPELPWATSPLPTPALLAGANPASTACALSNTHRFCLRAEIDSHPLSHGSVVRQVLQTSTSHICTARLNGRHRFDTPILGAVNHEQSWQV